MKKLPIVSDEERDKVIEELTIQCSDQIAHIFHTNKLFDKFPPEQGVAVVMSVLEGTCTRHFTMLNFSEKDISEVFLMMSLAHNKKFKEEQTTIEA